MNNNISANIRDFDPIIHGVLKRFYPRVCFGMDIYDDLVQELRLVILREQVKNKTLSPTNNPLLFTLLRCRAINYLKKQQLIQERYTPSEIDENVYFADANVEKNLIDRETLSWLQNKLSKKLDQLILTDIIMFPDDNLVQRQKRLGIPRATFFRAIKKVREILRDRYTGDAC